MGQILQSNLSESALATVQDKAGKFKGAAFEVKAVIEDFLHAGHGHTGGCLGAVGAGPGPLASRLVLLPGWGT